MRLYLPVVLRLAPVALWRRKCLLLLRSMMFYRVSSTRRYRPLSVREDFADAGCGALLFMWDELNPVVQWQLLKELQISWCFSVHSTSWRQCYAVDQHKEKSFPHSLVATETRGEDTFFLHTKAR